MKKFKKRYFAAAAMVLGMGLFISQFQNCAPQSLPSTSVGTGASSGNGAAGTGTGTGNGTGGGSVTCSLKINNVMQVANYSLNVGDNSTWLIESTGIPSGYKAYWYGTSGSSTDLNHVLDVPVSVSPYKSPYDGRILLSAGGIAFTRWVSFQNDSGTEICNTKTANSGKPITLNVFTNSCVLSATKVPKAGGVSSTSTSSMSAVVDDTITYQMTSNLAAPIPTNGIFWSVKKDGTLAVNDENHGINNYDGPLLAGSAGSYDVWVILKDASGFALCDSRMNNTGYGITKPFNLVISN